MNNKRRPADFTTPQPAELAPRTLEEGRKLDGKRPAPPGLKTSLICYPTACFDRKTDFECGAIEQGEPATAKVATTSAGSSSKPATVPAISVRRSSTLLRPVSWLSAASFLADRRKPRNWPQVLKRIKTESGASAPLPLGVSASLPPANSHACAIDLDDDSDLECTGVLTLEQRDVQAKASAAATGALVVIEDNEPHELQEKGMQTTISVLRGAAAAAPRHNAGRAAAAREPRVGCLSLPRLQIRTKR